MTENRTVPNHCRLGRGGWPSAEARSIRDGSLSRMAALVVGQGVIDDTARIAAARALLATPSRVVPRATVEQTMAAVRKIMADDSTSDAAVVEGYTLLCELAERGRRLGKAKKGKLGAA